MTTFLSESTVQLNVFGGLFLILSGVFFHIGKSRLNDQDREYLAQEIKHPGWLWLVTVLMVFFASFKITGVVSTAAYIFALVALLFYVVYEIKEHKALQVSASVKNILLLRTVLIFGAVVFLAAGLLGVLVGKSGVV